MLHSIYLFDIYNMDPRPIHFDYRRPRVSNPTYLSKELYNRIQQQRDMTTGAESPINPELKRANSTDIQSLNQSQMENLSSRYNSRGSLGSNQKLSNSMANYGRSVLGRSNSSRREQQDVFERQERNFNIISYWPRSVQPTLHKFPKLTLQDKLLEMDITDRH